jgi:hypothetical protein
MIIYNPSSRVCAYFKALQDNFAVHRQRVEHLAIEKPVTQHERRSVRLGAQISFLVHKLVMGVL